MHLSPLTPSQLAVLAAVHRGDEEEGGLAIADLETDEREALDALVRRGLVEIRTVDDEDPLGGAARISARGVEVLRDMGIRRG